MRYLPIPIEMLPVGTPLPVNVWTPQGLLLLRKGQPIVSEEHRSKLYGHNASTTEAEGLAWQRAYERMVHTMLQQGCELLEIARAPMPGVIRERDYQTGEQVSGGWLDLQEVLRGILYQGGLALNPVQRLVAIENKVRGLLINDADDSLFCLFQALADNTLGYCATHALLCAVLCELAAQKLGYDMLSRQALTSAALTMNIGMAREQDVLSRQKAPPNEAQRSLIRDHPELSVAILQGFAMDDPLHIDLVRWHHRPDAPEALPGSRGLRELLHMCDVFVAKMAARKAREAMSPLKSVKSLFVAGDQPSDNPLGAALGGSVGFYPPGTYVRMGNGAIALCVQRGARASTPWVMLIVGPDGVATVSHHCLDTAEPAHAIAAAITPSSAKVVVSLERVRRARERIRR